MCNLFYSSILLDNMFNKNHIIKFYLIKSKETLNNQEYIYNDFILEKLNLHLF